MTKTSIALTTKVWWLVSVAVISGCASAPLDYPKQRSSAVARTTDGREAAAVSAWLDGNADSNGFYPLIEGLDAFGARLKLMSVAESSIDAQYFLMKPDEAGLVFANKMLEAADRGVRVRFLLDDIFTTVEDRYLAVLNGHPNIEVRIFNPIARKGIYAFNYLGNFSLANRRMHNKAFIIDNQVAVVGGRNIAAEYYQLDTSGEFVDFDMLTAGPVVAQVSSEFDIYWNHKLAVPMEALYQERDPERSSQARASLDEAMTDAGNSIYGEAVSTPLMQQLLAGEIPPYTAEAELITDAPDKLVNDIAADQQIIVNRIREVLREAEREIYIFTPYLIPRKSGIEFLREVRNNGVRVVIVTNSLATNNHTSVFSSYKSYRKDMLEAGVELWEARADAAQTKNATGEVELENLTLHTKGMIIDREKIFVGSLNLDPRSADINTEMGLLIDSPEMAQELADGSDRRIPEIAYRLKLGDNNKITWHATIDGKTVVETKEPQTTAWRRFQAWFLKIAPENQL